MLSVNQMAAQIKLTEMWKASNDTHYPTKKKMRNTQVEGMEARICTQGDLTESGGLTREKKSFNIGEAKFSIKIRTAKTLATAKKAIRAQWKISPI